MTASDRFDPFERRITEAIDEIAAARRPDYLDDIFRQTARTAQRPRWSFPERWFKVDTTFSRSVFGGRVPFRLLIILAVVAALLAASLAFYIGSQKRLPPAFGPARNGTLAFSTNGDIYVGDQTDAGATLLVGGAGDQGGPSFSPDGLLIAYDNVVDGIDHLWVVDANGQNARQVFDRPLVNGDEASLATWISWSGDSRHLAIVTPDSGRPGLWIAAVDGSVAQRIDLGSLTPNRSAVWDPLVPGQVLIRALDAAGKVDLFLVNTANGTTTQLNVSWPAAFGRDWDLSGHVFSDDGRVIAYNVITNDPSFAPAGYYRIGLVNRDGTNPRMLPGPADHAINEGWPTFSPDGRWISAQRFSWNDTDGLKASLALLPADGSAVGHDLLPAGTAGQSTFDVTWAPDSSQLFVWSAGPARAYLIDPVTGDRQALDWIHDVATWQRRAP